MARFFLRKGVRPGDRVARSARPRDRSLCGAVRASEGRARPMSRSTPTIRPNASGSFFPTPGRRSSSPICGSPTGSPIAKRRRSILDGMRGRDRRARRRAADRRRTRAGARRALLRSLHVGDDRPSRRASRSRHPSICNFVRVAAEHYGFGPGDRVYQGMSVAFDFSIEEIWVPLVAGATLVPNTAATSLFGEELAESPRIARRHLPLLRADAARVDRSRSAEAAHPADRRRGLSAGAGQALEPARAALLLNSYGPTETTVTATLGLMTPGQAGDDRPAAADLFDRHSRRRSATSRSSSARPARSASPESASPKAISIDPS